ncbi:pilus assembly protein TadG-related protein [Sphingomonas sp.]|uniref:pilus assembly protein TadG-related protein n=1 Tax=Sphingomonas sp. TaxID=28214 RepID=UPI001B25D689|nr:pilus assembly protein TadG-related protein [Sphingomonas sp.]MBO9712033.1 TadE/TadG family protein [Sphingomonas sp.]
MGQKQRDMATPGTFLTRLIRDVRANTIAIMAIALIPLAGLVGGGVDISRLYIVKTRLQHACDAGALAGRKTMGGGTWAQTVNGVSNYPNTQAVQFFDSNYNSAAYGATGVTRSFSENAGKVTGTASATVPMTLMRIFGRTEEVLSVTCDAEMRLPNTDVMFVLDTTGSMGDTPSGDSKTKLQSLKSAVKCFYEIVARLDTDENCTTGNPSGGTGNQVQIRFGFVPYATNVNVGKLLPTSYFANSWPYQSREAQWNANTTYTYPNQGTPTVTSGPTENWTGTGNWQDKAYSKSGTSSTNCQNNVPADTATQNNGSAGSPYNVNTSTSNGVQTVTYKVDQPIVKTQYRYDSYTGNPSKLCYYDTRQATGTATTTYRRVDQGVAQTTYTFKQWHYGRITQDISGLKNGTNWNSSFTLPIGSNGTSKTITWDGCVEERATVKQSSYDPIPDGAKDLNIDLVPSQSDASTLWGPVLDDMIYTPQDPGGWWGGSSYWTYTGPNDTTDEVYSTSDYVNGSSYQCPTQAKKLQAWTDPDAFDTYVDSLTANGNTYHDIGLLWGARLMSPTGIFASENAYTLPTSDNPGGGEIERHLIFMTDGDPCTSVGNYQAYGVAWFDRRQTDASSAPTDGCTDTGTLTAQVNARTAALCTAIKNKNITLWVITFGTLSSSTVTRMTACATSGRYFNATNAATIQSTFKSIADQISQLRLTR